MSQRKTFSFVGSDAVEPNMNIILIKTQMPHPNICAFILYDMYRTLHYTLWCRTVVSFQDTLMHIFFVFVLTCALALYSDTLTLCDAVRRKTFTTNLQTSVINHED